MSSETSINPDAPAAASSAPTEHSLPSGRQAGHSHDESNPRIADILSKLTMTAGSMAVSAVLYAWLFGWPFSLGLVGLLFIHEMGHWITARQKKIKVSPPLFIPFVGAFIHMAQKPQNAATMAYVGLAGPVVGAMGALACQLLGLYLHNATLLKVAYFGYVFNLFNMTPYGMLDGGHVIAAVTPKLWVGGLLLLLGWGALTHNFVVFLLIFLNLPDVISAFGKKARDPYYRASWQSRCLWAVAFLLTVTSLVLVIATFGSVLKMFPS